MKKTLSTTMATGMLLAMMTVGCGTQKQAVAGSQYAGGQTVQPVAPIERSNEKAAERLAKQWTAEGFKVESMAFSMEEKIAAYRQKLLNDDNNIELVSEGVGATSFSAEQQALNAAAISYATAAGSVVKGGMERDFGNIGGNYDVFHGSYVQDVATFVMPLLKREMKFQKREGNDYVVKVGYILNENAAAEARKKALDKTIKTVAGGQAIGEKIRKYVDEVVRPDNNDE